MGTTSTKEHPMKSTESHPQVYIAREIIGVEWLSEVEGELTDVELDHWAYGPHHLWSYPESGQILRMWQPFNGLQVSKVRSNRPCMAGRLYALRGRGLAPKKAY